MVAASLPKDGEFLTVQAVLTRGGPEVLVRSSPAQIFRESIYKQSIGQDILISNPSISIDFRPQEEGISIV